ncbi:hypothetical protein LSCM1_07320 [Leishmania martiniquensis]|uniref:Nucleoplasmin-like domain-containing protein n=1 Tax=Leishmania martiniquensis TaxID=1580590 RepID=A0A836KX65_9TRYP|nr:hypothetical protein LSCM1_07320 [Leishmania martiniquensis]
MLNCFFGAELKPDGVPVSFAIPKGTSLVITQCAVTSVVPPQQSPRSPADTDASSSPSVAAQAYSPVTLCVQGHGLPTRFAVCSLSPAQKITYCPLQLLFSEPVSFVLVPQTGSSAAAGKSSSLPPASQRGKKMGRNEKRDKTAAGAHGGGAAAASAAYPTVHLTGYYERAADEDEDDGVAMSAMAASDEENENGFDEA